MQLIPFCVIIITLVIKIGQSQASTCSPSFILPNILKDIATLQYYDQSQQSYTYPFFSLMFSRTPIIAYSIAQLEINQISQALNFYLDVQVSSSVNFYFNAISLKWTIISVNFWVTSRADIAVISTTILNIPPGQSSTKTIQPPNNNEALIDSTSSQVNFIVGLYCTILGQNLTLNVSSGTISTAGSSLTVTTGPAFITNITILTILYNPNSGQFVSHGGSAHYLSFTSQHINLLKNVIPIYYVLMGFNALSLTGTFSAHFQFNLGVVSGFILEATTISKFDSFSFSFITIGANPSSICSPCNNYISDGACADTCPSLSYPYTFSTGGNACLTCSDLVGQRLNQLGTACICLPGYELLTDNQCYSSSSLSTTCSGNNVVQNGTSCICSPGTYNLSGICGTCLTNQVYSNGKCITSTICSDPNSEYNSGSLSCTCKSGYSKDNTGLCIVSCPSNSAYNAAVKGCQCNFGFVNISNVCVACGQGQYYDSASLTCKCTGMNQQLNSQGICQCSSGFYNISGFCLECPQGTTYSNGICAAGVPTPTEPTITCSANQILQNGVCVCDSNSVSVGSICVKCLDGTYPNIATKMCDSCAVNCQKCINKVSCSQCATGYVFDFSLLACASIMPVKVKLTSIRSGFPVYTTPGIVTDFVINSTSVSAKTSQEVAQMISVQFTDVNTIPQRIVYAQNTDVHTIFRVSFIYSGCFPLIQFNTTFNFNDVSLGLSQSSTVSYKYEVGKVLYLMN